MSLSESHHLKTHCGHPQNDCTMCSDLCDLHLSCPNLLEQAIVFFTQSLVLSHCFFSSLNVMLNSGSLSIAFSRKLYFTSVCSGKCCLGGDSSCSLLFYSESAVSTGSCFLFTELAFSSLFWWWKSGLHYPQWRVTSCFGCQYLSTVTGNHGVMMLPWIAVIQSMVFSFFSWYSWKVINRSGWYHDMSVGIEIWTLR